METENKTIIKAITAAVLLSALVNFGGEGMIHVDYFDNYYVCPLTEEVMYFNGSLKHPEPLSKSEKTGYYMEDGESQKMACRSGYNYEPWASLKAYAESKGIDPLTLISKDVQEPISSAIGGSVIQAQYINYANGTSIRVI